MASDPKSQVIVILFALVGVAIAMSIVYFYSCSFNCYSLIKENFESPTHTTCPSCS
jgi:hypothetical protein